MQKEVLIVESERRVADALVLRLTGRGYGVASAATRAEASAALGRRRPDLVILGLPAAAELIDHIRGRVGKGVPMIALAGPEVALPPPSVDELFRKPGGIEAVVRAVTSLLGQSRPSTSVDGAEPPSVDETVDFSSLNALVWTEPPRRLRSTTALRTPEAGPSAPPSVDFSALRGVASSAPTRLPPPDASEESADLSAAEPVPEALASWVDEPGGTADSAAPAIPPRPSLSMEPPTPPPPASRPPRIGLRSRIPPRVSAPPLASAPPADRPGAGYSPPAAPVSPDEVLWQARLQAGRTLPLSERSVGSALAAAWRLGITGRLEVAAGGVLRRVFLDHGAPCFADSSDPDEDLAAWLAEEGLVTRTMVGRARVRARQLGATAEEVLIEQGFLTPDAVYRALHSHVVERVVALFGLEAGEGLVVQGGPRPLDPVDLGLPPPRLLIDGVRRRYGRLRLYRAFGTPVVVPRILERPSPGALQLRADEEAALRACDGRRTVAEVARAARLAEVDVLAILHAMALLGFVEPPLAGRTALPPLDGALTARAAAARTPDELPGYPDLVARKLTEAQTADYFTVLEVPRGVTGAELEAAWQTLRRRFDPNRVRRDSPLHPAVHEIAAVLADAYAMLVDARRRAHYEAALGDV